MSHAVNAKTKLAGRPSLRGSSQAPCTAHPPPWLGAVATQCPLVPSQVNPSAQSFESVQLALHAPNATSQTYSRQSNAAPPPVGHAAPCEAQTAGPTPVDLVTHLAIAQAVPALAAVHAPLPSHVDTQLAPPPQLR
ncbi:MAG: hypothetical protein ACHREM_05770, partial [Polyangiales bacterium]